MSGDGLQDIVLVHDGACVYWPSLGYGNWGVPVRMRDSPRFPYGYDPKRILVGDVDGDGVADLVYVDDRRISLWVNQSGNGWSAPIVIAGTTPVSDHDVVRLVDVLGRGGRAAVEHRAGRARRGIDPRLHRRRKPCLLGGWTTTSARRALTHTCRHPSWPTMRSQFTFWRTPLPFPVRSRAWRSSTHCRRAG